MARQRTFPLTLPRHTLHNLTFHNLKRFIIHQSRNPSFTVVPRFRAFHQRRQIFSRHLLKSIVQVHQLPTIRRKFFKFKTSIAFFNFSPKPQPRYEEEAKSVDEDDQLETNGQTETVPNIKASVQVFDGLLASLAGIDEFDEE